MRNWDELRTRYLRDGLHIRLGGLAANLSRVESFADEQDHGDVVLGIIRESEYFIDWTAPDAAPELRASLAELRLRLTSWRSAWDVIWSNPVRRADVAREAGAWSQRVLAMSGLLQPSDRPA